MWLVVGQAFARRRRTKRSVPDVKRHDHALAVKQRRQLWQQLVGCHFFKLRASMGYRLAATVPTPPKPADERTCSVVELQTSASKPPASPDTNSTCLAAVSLPPSSRGAVVAGKASPEYTTARGRNGSGIVWTSAEMPTTSSVWRDRPPNTQSTHFLDGRMQEAATMGAWTCHARGEWTQ